MEEVRDVQLHTALLNCFIRIGDEEIREAEPTDGEYVTYAFDTLRNPSGDGDFIITFYRPNAEAEWAVIDYTPGIALPSDDELGG